ncbi:cyclic nucleotide-binding domain-containing protein [Bacteriovoracaceae bacterium]|nr:cyclic nucleotide-binding domain-containing protein [Bacteriovoracaceae bacterium]
MPTIIKKAESSDEINDVLELRYRVLCNSERVPNRLFAATKKVSDHYDVHPSTINIIAYNSGKVVGTIRAIEYIPEDNISNSIYDYSESFSNLNDKAHTIDLIAIDKNFGGHDIFIEQMLKTTLTILTRQKIKYCFFNVPLHLARIATKLGYSKLSEPFFSKELEQEVIPMLIDVENYYDHIYKEIKDREILRFQDVFYDIIFEPGEILVVQGEKGSTAYLIESGEVEVLITKDDDIFPVATIGSGHLVGEVAMVTSEVRTASIMAKTTTCCIAFDRDDFMNIMYDHPHRVLDIFKIFSKRLNESNSKIAALSNRE